MRASISLPMAIIIGMNAIIGAGVLTAPSALQVSAGPAGILTYLFVIGAIMSMALSLARLAQLYPGSGAFYTYAASWGGHVAGTATTLCYLAGLITAMGLLGQFAGAHLADYIAAPPLALGAATIALLVGLNLAGAVISQAGQIVLIVLTLIPLALISALSLANANRAHLVPFAPHGVSGVVRAIKFVIFGFFGFEAIPSLFDSIQNPKKNVPRAIILTILLVGMVYLTFSGSVLIGLPTDLFEGPKMPISAALKVIYPNLTWLTHMIDWAIIITIMGTVHSMLWSVSSLFADTYGKVLPGRSMRFSTALVILGALTMGSCIFFTNPDTIFAVVAIGITLTFALSILSLILQPQKRTGYQIAIGTCGLATSGVIIACALLDLM